MPRGAHRKIRRLPEKARHIRLRYRMPDGSLQMTQDEMAEALNKALEKDGYAGGLLPANISHFERGVNAPDLPTLYAYAQVANVKPHVLLDNTLNLPLDIPYPYPYAYEGTKHVEREKKATAQGAETRLVTVVLKLEVIGANRLVRSANRVRANIERYHLKGYGMRRLEEGVYELTFTCKNEADINKKISDLIEEIENEAARDNCLIEHEVLESNDSRSK